MTSTTLSNESATDLRAVVRGPVLEPTDLGYDEARRVWNGMFDRRPAVIVQCTGVADVQEAIRFARRNDLTLGVRAGGHSLAGASSLDGGVLIDLRLMSGVIVDPEQRTAVAQGGVTWALFDRETQVHGLAGTGGVISTTGIGGLTLGGGVGRLMRKHGLTCDNVLSYDIVTADSELLHVTVNEHPDLFWALKGGGGDYGIVTSFKYQLHPVGPIVMGGFLGWPLAKAREVIAALRESIAVSPEELVLQFIFTTAPDVEFVPPELRGERAMLLAVTWVGALEDAGAHIRPFREAGPPHLDLVGEYPYALLQGFSDILAPEGRRNYLKSGYFDELDDDVLEVVLRLAEQFTSPFDLIELYQMGGAIARVDPSATAFGDRGAGFFYTALASWIDAPHDAAAMQWCRDVDMAMEPIKRPGRYINFVAETDDDALREAVGDETYVRLRAIKKHYDPTGCFSRNPSLRAVAVPAE